MGHKTGDMAKSIIGIDEKASKHSVIDEPMTAGAGMMLTHTDSDRGLVVTGMGRTNGPPTALK